MADNIIENIEDIDTTLNPVTKDHGLEMLGNVSDQPVVLRRFSRAIFKIGKLIKGLAVNKEDKFSKNSGFNKNKSDVVNSSDSNTLATSKAVKVSYDKAVDAYNLAAGCPYGVGDYWTTESNSNPATKWIGTAWTKLVGRVLLGTSSSYPLGAQGGRSTVALTLANIAAHTHGFSGTTNTTGNHYHQGGNHRHRVDNHAHTQPSHRHQIKVGRNDDGYGGYVSTALGNYVGWKTDPCNSAGGENTGGASPYTNYQNPNTSTTGNHNHTISGTTGSSGSGSAFNIMNPYRVVNIWRRTV